MTSIALLATDEPAAANLYRADGASSIVLTCDHAGSLIPRRLGSLGLAAPDLQRHIAWDIGALAVSKRLAERLDAPLAYQTYSRLVIDCNRLPQLDSAIPAVSDGSRIAGNTALSAADRAAWVDAVFWPYHRLIADHLDRRSADCRSAVLVAMHSFTPRLEHAPADRPWHIGMLFNRDRRLADALIRLLHEERSLQVGENQPYSVGDNTDYTIPVHGEQRGIPHVEIEIRQDLVGDESGQAQWAAQLARLLPLAIVQSCVLQPGSGLRGTNVDGGG